MKNNRFFLGFFWTLHAALPAIAQTPDHALDNADSLFRQYNLAASHQAYTGIAAVSAFPKIVRTKAYQQIAQQDWKFYHDYPGAIRALTEARDLKTDGSALALLQSSIEDQAGKYKEAIATAKPSLPLAGIAFARAVQNENFFNQAHRLPLTRPQLEQAALILERILEKQPGNPDASELLIGIGLLLKEGTRILAAWRSYYLVADERMINPVLQPGYAKLKSVLTTWHGTPLSIAAMQTLAIGFADTKFFRLADFIIDELKQKDPAALSRSPELNDIEAYNSYIIAVQTTNDQIYPEVARGRQHYEDAYDSLMAIPARTLWNQLSFIAKSRKFDPDSFYNEMNRRFDMEGYSGTTVNYYGMLMGHIIHKEPKQIEQYGYKTNFTFISVDRLISRDFTSWYGTTNVGGWGDSTSIIQVRAAYMTEPFELLSWMTDSTAQRNILLNISTKKTADYSVCKADPYAEPSFLALYLKYKEASIIYRRLADSGLSRTALNIAFIDQIFRLTIASTIFAHEGRHAIDQLYFPQEFKTMSDDERELRAKFSEVIYSLNPKMAFTGSILGSTLDENTNHGKANKRFRKIIVDWMSAHQHEIEGLDPVIPLLMQFDLLTDTQLIAICKSADPLAPHPLLAINPLHTPLPIKFSANPVTFLPFPGNQYKRFTLEFGRCTVR